MRKKKIKIQAVGLREHREIQGIHLIDPDRRDIEDALESAERDGFKTVFAHFSNVVTLDLYANEKYLCGAGAS